MSEKVKLVITEAGSDGGGYHVCIYNPQILPKDIVDHLFANGFGTGELAVGADSFISGILRARTTEETPQYLEALIISAGLEIE